MNVQSTTLPDPPVSYETENDISPDRRSELVTLMNQRLADAVDLQLQMKQAHWNVKGPNFIALHHLFDEVEADVRDYVDLIAERVVQLGGTAEGTVRISASRTRLVEYPVGISTTLAHLEAVARALAAFGSEARTSIDLANALDDAGTADVFTEVSRGTDKWLWMVEAHFQSTQ
jgi:starvation-inducible DNA-binding protein